MASVTPVNTKDKKKGRGQQQRALLSTQLHFNYNLFLSVYRICLPCSQSKFINKFLCKKKKHRFACTHLTQIVIYFFKGGNSLFVFVFFSNFIPYTHELSFPLSLNGHFGTIAMLIFPNCLWPTVMSRSDLNCPNFQQTGLSAPPTAATSIRRGGNEDKRRGDCLRLGGEEWTRVRPLIKRQRCLLNCPTTSVHCHAVMYSTAWCYQGLYSQSPPCF